MMRLPLLMQRLYCAAQHTLVDGKLRERPEYREHQRHNSPGRPSPAFYPAWWLQDEHGAYPVDWPRELDGKLLRALLGPHGDTIFLCGVCSAPCFYIEDLSQ